MPIPKTTLEAIQSAGAAVHRADTALKEVVLTYSDQVRSTMSSNPFDLQADSLFEEWKTVARLSQTLEQIEAELRKVHHAAQQLGEGGFVAEKASARLGTSSDQSTFPALTGVVPLAEAINATDVVAKKPKKIEVAAHPAKARKSTSKAELSPNTRKLWEHLKTRLTAKKFTVIKRTQVGVDAGLPTGSVAASFSKLFEHGYVEENATGALKLLSKK